MGAFTGAQHTANNTTVQSHDHTEHSVMETLPTYASNSNESTTLLNSLLSSSCSTASNLCSINVTSGDHIIHFHHSSYTVNMAHVIYQCSQAIYDNIGSLILMEEPMEVWQVLMSACFNIVSNFWILWE